MEKRTTDAADEKKTASGTSSRLTPTTPLGGKGRGELGTRQASGTSSRLTPTTPLGGKGRGELGTRQASGTSSRLTPTTPLGGKGRGGQGTRQAFSGTRAEAMNRPAVKPIEKPGSLQAGTRTATTTPPRTLFRGTELPRDSVRRAPSGEDEGQGLVPRSARSPAQDGDGGGGGSGGAGGGGGSGGGAAASEAKKKNSLLQGDTDSSSKPASLTVCDKVAAWPASRVARASPETEDGSARALHLRDKDRSRVSHRPQFGFATPKATASYTVAAQAKTDTTTSKSSSWSAPSPQLTDSQTGAPSLTPAPQEPERNRPADQSETNTSQSTTAQIPTQPRCGNPAAGREMTATAKTAATGRETTTAGVLSRQALPEKGRQPVGASAGVPGDEDLGERSPGSCDKNEPVPEPRGMEGAARLRPAPDGARLVVNGESGKDKPQQSVSPLRHGAELSFLTRDLKTKHKFSLAFDHQNQVAATAIKSLDSLNDQIVQYIFGQADHHGHVPTLDLHPDPLSQGHGVSGTGGGGGGGSTGGGGGVVVAQGCDLSQREQDNLHTSIVLIRRLLQDAQGKFRKMVEENKELAVRIDGSIQSAHQEVHALRAELADTNKRLSQISTSAEEEGVSEDKGCDGGVGVGGGSSSTHDGVAGSAVRSGVKETDIDGCFSSGGSGGGGPLGGGGGSSCGSGGVGGARTKEGEEKMDANKEEVASGRTEGEACSRGSSARGDGGLAKGCQVADDTAADSNSSLISRLRDDNARLEKQVRCLCQEVTSLKAGAGGEGAANSHPSHGELNLELIQARQELSRAKEALQAMKSDRKRLKAEKVDLLHQMKQLYITLEDKESELRDFIRNYEQRVQESDESIKQLALEKEESEREKWEIIKRARESAERAVVLRTQLDAREQTIRELQDEVAKLKEQLAGRGLDDSRDSNNTTPTPADDNGHEADVIEPTSVTATTTTSISATSTPGGSDGSSSNHTTPATNTATTATPESTGSESGSCYTPDGYLSKDESFSGSTPLGTPTFSDRGNESLSSLMKWMALGNEGWEPSDPKNAKKKKKSFGSLSRVFGRGRARRSIALPHNENLFEDGSGMKLSLLTQDNYQEKLATVEAMGGLHMCQWRAGQVLAWLEINLGMPMYGRNCALNIKSGKVLLGLSDSELGTALGITNHMHRRKLRMAIEEHRDPATIKFAQAPKLDVTWVAHKLLPELGLPQYSHVFERNLVDGRILNSLCRRDLEKHFDIHRKFHQASILHAVELLRRMEFDREKLAERRGQCEDSDSDLLVWTCSRLIQWIRSIDLGEFADNLHESGVHGALMVLEPTFNSDTLATALAIPPSKSYIRRHLATELDTLLRPARAALDTPNNNSKHLDPGGKGHTFTRSYRGQTSDDGSKGRLSFRGSLGRAFGKKIRDDLKLAFDSDSPKWKISAPIPIQHTSLDNVVEIPGDSTAV